MPHPSRPFVRSLFSARFARLFLYRFTVALFAAAGGLAAGGIMPCRAQVSRWITRYEGAANTYNAPYSAVLDPQGNVIITGTAGKNSAGTEFDYQTVKYSGATGATLWTVSYNGSFGSEIARAVGVDAQGNVFVTGQSQHPQTQSGFDDDFATIKYNGATGAQIWAMRYDGPSHSVDRANALAVDAQGNVVVAGGSEGDSVTIKYNGATGAVLWGSRYSGGGANGSADARALALDAQGNVVVTGVASDESPYNYDYVTVKYNGATGAQAWVSRYDSAENGTDAARAVALDAQGNVFVTGSSNRDFVTVKYNGATGSEAWASRYVGPGNSYDGGYALAVDAQGDIVVVGEVRNGPSGFSDYATIKYHGATGAQAWVATYNGPSAGNDSPRAVTIDAEGSVFVAGVSDNFVSDFATVKYRGATGTQLSVARYNGAESGSDIPSAMALNPQGDIFVTGSSSGATGTGFATIRYAAVRLPRLPGGFAATDLATGDGVTIGIDGQPDANLRVLWAKPATNQAQIWSAPGGGNGAVLAYSPVWAAATYAPVSLSVHPVANKAQLLWRRVSGSQAGQVAVWTLPPGVGIIEAGTAYGPLAGGWTMVDQQTGGDNKVRLLWRQPSTGRLALWRLNAAASAIEAGAYIAAPPGYNLVPQIAVGRADNKTRLAWIKPGASGQIAVWTMGVNLQVETGRTFAAANYTLQGFGVGADNKVRLAWAKNGSPSNVSLWTLPASGANNEFESARAYTLPAGMQMARLRVSPANRYLLLLTPAAPGPAPLAEAWVVSPDAYIRESVTPLGE